MNFPIQVRFRLRRENYIIYLTRVSLDLYYMDSSWYFQNTVREIIIYDKKLELKENQKVKYYDKEVMRIEYRLLGRRTCHNDFPFSTFGELLDDGDSL